jgi:3-isopropylmalate dehydrogenase
MAKYKIAWLPGDGIGIEVLEAAKIVLEKINLDAEYIHGDIGWEFWCKEGDAFPQRKLNYLRTLMQLCSTITSKPIKRKSGAFPELKGKGLVYRS